MRTTSKTYTMAYIEMQRPYHDEPFIGDEPVMTQDIIITVQKPTKYTSIKKEIILSFILN